MRSKITVVILFVVMSCLMWGCFRKTAVSELRLENSITYTHDQSMDDVSVFIGNGYEYLEFSERSFRGVEVEGHLFGRREGETILVSRMERREFEELVQVKLDAPLTEVTAYPARTVFEPTYCRLVRAYVVALHADVVAVVSAREMGQPEEPCNQWPDLSSFSTDNPGIATEFNESSDNAIHMKWN